ncbi:MAG: hypothetical protein PW788_15750 [Micavibrio sp.]|nr:hypothetical protein [Micavibrio sp.]
MKPIKLTIARQPEGVYMVTSDALPGFVAELSGGEGMLAAAELLARDFLRMDDPAAQASFEFDIQ